MVFDNYAGEINSYPENSDGQVLFTSDWFSDNINQWDKYKDFFDNKPNIHCLELGSYQGRSALYIVNNYCNGAGSYLDAVDTWKGSVEHNNKEKSNLEGFFINNTFKYLQAGTIKMHKGFSSDFLIKAVQEVRLGVRDKYNFIYIDASHVAKDVLLDAVLSWEILKDNGIIAFDDYNWDHYKNQPCNNPKIAIDAFLQIYDNKYEILHKDYQVHIRKK